MASPSNVEPNIRDRLRPGSLSTMALTYPA
jgi:hypothetical protein